MREGTKAKLLGCRRQYNESVIREKTTENQGLGRAIFFRNGMPDGYMVRLANMEEKHFPTATIVEENPDGSVDIYFDRLFLAHYDKGEHLTFWPVQKEREQKKYSLTRQKIPVHSRSERLPAQ